MQDSALISFGQCMAINHAGFAQLTRDVDHIGMPGRDAQLALTTSTNHYRRMGFLHPLGAAKRAFKPVMPVQFP